MFNRELQFTCITFGTLHKLALYVTKCSCVKKTKSLVKIVCDQVVKVY